MFKNFLLSTSLVVSLAGNTSPYTEASYELLSGEIKALENQLLNNIMLADYFAEPGTRVQDQQGDVYVFLDGVWIKKDVELLTEEELAEIEDDKTAVAELANLEPLSDNDQADSEDTQVSSLNEEAAPTDVTIEITQPTIGEDALTEIDESQSNLSDSTIDQNQVFLQEKVVEENSLVEAAASEDIASTESGNDEIESIVADDPIDNEIELAQEVTSVKDDSTLSSLDMNVTE